MRSLGGFSRHSSSVSVLVCAASVGYDIEAAGLSLEIYSFSNTSMSVGPKLKTIPVEGTCAGGAFAGTASMKGEAGMPTWLVTKLRNGGSAGLVGVTLGVAYDSDGTLH
jgi:hypothetical protein